nr:MAG TPA: Thiol:disulfide interchange protein DsbD [Caudoviricetes sp.]
MATEYKIILDPNVKKITKDYGLTFSNNDIFKPKRQLMATDVVRELKKLIEENGDKPVLVSTGFEYCDACKVSTYSDGSIRIGT